MRAWELSDLLVSEDGETAHSLVRRSHVKSSDDDFPRQLCIVKDVCITITNRGNLTAESFYTEV